MAAVDLLDENRSVLKSDWPYYACVIQILVRKHGFSMNNKNFRGSPKGRTWTPI